MEANALIVPIHLDALCVSPLEQPAGRLSGFAPATLQNLEGLPFLGDNKPAQVAAVSQHFHTPPFTAGSARPGVHLHWALPDALTHGRHVYQVTADALNEMRCLGVSAEVISAVEHGVDPTQVFAREEQLVEQLGRLLPRLHLDAFQRLILQACGRLIFPCVPNRWLLVRLITDMKGQNPAIVGWVIESDFLSTNGQYDGHTVTPSPGGLADQPPWRYMGRARAVQPGVVWQEDATAERYPDLTALGYGELGFAAYYPNCHTVFGHHETIDKLAPPTFASGANRLAYAVIGWHSDPAGDPLHGVSDIRKTLASLGWDAGEGGAADDVYRSIYFGMVHDVQWDPARPADQYVADVSEPVEVAVGNTAAEALAAYLARHTPPADSAASGRSVSAETLIEALQHDLLGEIHLADGDFEQLEHAVHEQAFRALPGGSEWVIGKTQAAHAGTQSAAQHFDQKAQQGAFTPAPLAPAIAARLSELNDLQRHYDALQFETADRRWQLFADWQRSMLIAYPGLTTADSTPLTKALLPALNNLAGAGVAQLEEAFAELAHMVEAIASEAADLQREVGTQYTLRCMAAPRFWQPTDPTLLLAGTDVNPSIRYGADRLFGEGNTLACRPDSQIVTQLVGGSQISATSLKGTQIAPPAGLDVAVFDALLVEAVLIDRWLASAAGSLNQAHVASGKAPAAIAVNRWGNAAHTGRNSWHPLFLHWEIDAIALPQQGPAADLIRHNATLLPHALDLSYREQAFDTLSHTGSHQGVVLLTPHATRTLVGRLERLLPAGLEEDLKLALEQLPVMSQTLQGFNDSLLMRARQNQFRIEDPYNPQQVAPPGLNIIFDPPLWKKVQAAVGRMNNAAPLPHTRFAPLRSGFAAIRRLWLVDAFGQFKAFSGDALPRPITPATLRPPAALGGQVDFALPPRVVQPTRLTLRWVAAAAPNLFMSAHPDTTPICGWVLPNHLDRSMMIYDNEGRPLGSLRAGVPQADRWAPAPGVTPPPPPSQISDQTLQKMVVYLLSLDEDAFSNYLQSIEQVLLTIEPPTYREHNALSVLMGRPLALAQIHVAAELKGMPAVDQSYETLAQLIDQQPKRDKAPADSLHTSHNFTAVELPVRLGDVVTERDGLVCAFSGTARAFTAHHVEVDAAGHHDRDDEDDVWLSLSTRHEDDALVVPLLLDPRAKIHATSGFLPVQSTAIPPEFYADVLQRMGFTFLVNPLLTAAAPLTLPLPAETSHSWDWYDPLHGWTRQLTPTDDRAHLEAAAQQIREGWLRMRPYAADTRT